MIFIKDLRQILHWLVQPVEDKILEENLTEQQHAHAHVYVRLSRTWNQAPHSFLGWEDETVNTEMRFTLDRRNTCFVMRESDTKLPREVMQSPSLEVFETWQDKALSILIS